MALSKKELEELAGAKQENLELTDFKFDRKEGCYLAVVTTENADGDEIEAIYKLNKLTFVGLDLLKSKEIPFTLLAPKAGQVWARAWF
jgi:hypothetical protein